VLHELSFNALPLKSGGVLRPATIVWAQYGLQPDRARRVWLILHGITSSQHAFVDAAPAAPDQGWMQDWADDGPFDLKHDCVLVPNALGSCYGTSGPAGMPLGSFPVITIADTVALYAQWLKRLSIKHLDVVLGYSYGGYQAFCWALSVPIPTNCAVVLASAPKGQGSLADIAALEALARRWDSGDPQVREQWLSMRITTLQHYGVADWLDDNGHDASPAALYRLAEAWAQNYPPHVLATLRRAAVQFDVCQALCEQGLMTPVLWMVNEGDRLFPSLDLPCSAPSMLTRIAVNGKYGHASVLLEAPLWTSYVRDWVHH